MSDQYQLSSGAESFGGYLLSNLGIAIWLLPLLAWYDFLKSLADQFVSQPDTSTGKFWTAIILTIIVFIIIWLMKRNSSGKTKVVGNGY